MFNVIIAFLCHYISDNVLISIPNPNVCVENDLINERTYKELLLKNKQEQDLLELKLAVLTNQEQQLKDKLVDLDKLMNKFNEYLDNLELTAEMVHSLIERIELSYPEIIDGVKCRKVKIIYKFIAESIDLD